MYTEKERNLANEAALTSSLLGNGLTSLRHANINNKGLYYQAFFSLSIGIERLMKMIIINEYRYENNGEFPINIDLKKIGHDLNKLSSYIGINFEENSVHNKILNFLNDFAKYSRYYNIDNILDKTNNNDPLNDWDNIREDIQKNIKLKKVNQNKVAIASLLEEISYVNFNEINGEELNSLIELLDKEKNNEQIQKYSVQYVYEIIRVLVNKIVEMEKQQFIMPILSEFFDIYYSKSMTEPQIRNKKDWTKK